MVQAVGVGTGTVGVDDGPPGVIVGAGVVGVDDDTVVALGPPVVCVGATVGVLAGVVGDATGTVIVGSGTVAVGGTVGVAQAVTLQVIRWPVLTGGAWPVLSHAYCV